ncbi:oleate hydratase [Spiroplasma platyhelix]|uniref:Oleate hydratase n=1 Tax=Spiroplasma platyhelix PALS-1 TaxID=1276218 RepID=A0A846TVR0_9MOLU|nr:oleate hydratase [Spiroplasma platyhelix]MBE4703859.1 Oleate hydratase [Spiroplasma platyhelix PALS-1]NKE38232.1 oleate hydratase [Spiroplasma platyhelix PALS-1]UJB29117.1 oleate hydratase [Spiroplasma platyhelix PALS-1]
MYKSNGNYEAFARPKKPTDVENKSAYLIGAGLASLSAATFLIRDGRMKPENIHIFEELAIPGGSLDGILNPDRGFILRGGREMENHFECLWDLFRSIPSLEIKDASVLDEFYWLNKEDPNYSKCRLIHKLGQRKVDDGKFTLSENASKEIIKLFLTKEESLNDKRIDEVFSADFFESNFWWYWSTMFAFEKWHSAMEMRRYVLRFIHHIGGLPDFSALKFTKYNQYESLVLPLITYLKEQGVKFEYETIIKNILVENKNGEKVAKKILLQKSGRNTELNLTENDLVFVTNGSITESTTYGNNTTPAPVTNELGASWELWKNLAKQDEAFGKPEKFCDNLPKESWFISATLTTLDKKITPYIEKISKRDPYAGKTVTGGIVTVTDSNWMLSYTLNRQPQFKKQPKDQLVVWIYGLLSNKEGNYIKKSITECTGVEIAQEWLYHMGVPEAEILDLAQNSCNVVPVRMPYITSYFMPRAIGDRPLVVPKGSKNLAFIGNFSETEADTVFTTEYSVRTAMEAVYTLLDIDRGVPEVFASAYDLRTLLNSTHILLDNKKIQDIKLPWVLRIFEKHGLKRIKGTFIEEMLEKAGLL